VCADLFMSMQPQYWLPSFLVQEYLWATGLCWPALPLAPSWFTGTQREALTHYKSHGLGWVFTKFYCQIAPPKMAPTQKYWKSLLQCNQMFLNYSVLLYQYALIQTCTVGLKLVTVNLLNLWVSCTLYRTIFIYFCLHSVWTRVHKNGRLEKERVTPIEAHSQGKISRQY